jgi:hypothetical protein
MSTRFPEQSEPRETPVLDHWDGPLPPSLIQISQMLKEHHLGGTVLCRTDTGIETFNVHVIHPAEVMLAYASLNFKPVYGNFLIENDSQTDALTAILVYWNTREAKPFHKTRADTLMRKDYDWYFTRALMKLYPIDLDYITGYYKGWEGDATFAVKKHRKWQQTQWESLQQGRNDGLIAHKFLTPTPVIRPS